MSYHAIASHPFSSHLILYHRFSSHHFASLFKFHSTPFQSVSHYHFILTSKSITCLSIISIIHLFEGGILDKMTNAEYATQSRMLGKEYNALHPTNPAETSGTNEPPPNDDNRNANGGNDINSKGEENAEATSKSLDSQIIQPLNLRMLQGAFIVLICGYAAAST